MPKNKHLTDEERLYIERLLKERVSFKQIAAKLGKSTSTISREISYLGDHRSHLCALWVCPSVSNNSNVYHLVF